MRPRPYSPEEEQWLLEKSDERDRLTDKALAETLNISQPAVRCKLSKLRKARSEKQRDS